MIKMPVRSEELKQYSGDAPQMNSPYAEVGYWTTAYALVDSADEQLGVFGDESDAQEIVTAINDHARLVAEIERYEKLFSSAMEGLRGIASTDVISKRTNGKMDRSHVLMIKNRALRAIAEVQAIQEQSVEEAK